MQLFGKSPVTELAPTDRTPFRKKLRWHLSTDETLKRLTVTPEMASEMLTYNDRNRPCSAGLVKTYAAAMKRGNWKYTKEPITFSPERLIQGQHRLTAIIESGCSIEADVAFGAPDDSFYVIDVGRKRTAGDIFAINGVPNSRMAAAATRILMAYDVGRMSRDDAEDRNAKVSLEDVYKAYCGYENLQESVHVGLAFAKARMPSPSAAAAVHYLCAKKSHKAADEYFKKVESGIGFSSKRDPAYKVRDFLVRSEVGSRMRRGRVVAALIEGWNAIRTRKPLKSVKADKIGRVI